LSHSGRYVDHLQPGSGLAVLTNLTYNTDVRVVAILAVLAVLAAAVASAAIAESPPIRALPLGPPMGSSATRTSQGNSAVTVLLSSNRAGAKHVTVTLRYTGALRCGRPIGATIELPLAVGVSAKVAASAVHLNGRSPGSVVVHKHSLAVGAPKTQGMMCDSITMGTVTLVLAPSAGIVNPSRAGSYQIRVVSGAATYSGAFSIS
jgi:hypothetical protein